MTGRRAAPGMPKEPCPLFMIAGRRATYQLPGVLVRASPLLLDIPTPDLLGLAYTWQDGCRLQLLVGILLLPWTSFCQPRAERRPCLVVTLIYDKTHVYVYSGHFCATYTSQECFQYLQSPSLFFVGPARGDPPIGHRRSRWQETRKTHYPGRYLSVYYTATSHEPTQPCSRTRVVY